MESLRHFIATIETNDAGTPHIWLVVPGAIITGQVASTKVYEDLFALATQDSEPANPETTARVQAILEKTNVMLSDRKDISQDPLSTIHMIKAVLISGSARVHVPFAEIAFDKVAAWGMGEAR